MVHSCRKNTLPTQQELNAQSAAQFPIGEAKDWFTGNKTALATKIKLNATEEGLSVIADFTPVWDSARTAADTNYYAVEAPAKYLKRILFSTDTIGANANGLTRLLVLKSKRFGSLSAVLMQIHSDGGTNINQVHFMDVPANFSGNIFYTTVQGVFLNGYIFKNGRIIRKSTGKATVAKPGGLQVLQYDTANDNCQDITVGWFMTNCWYTGGGEWADCSTLLLYTTTSTYCYFDDGDHGGGGGATPPPPDCPNGTHFVDGGCMVNDTVKKKTPCDQATLLTADTTFSNKMAKLKIASDGTTEQCFTGNFATNSFNFIQGVAHSVDPNITAPVDIIMHNHNAGVDYGCFDIDDIGLMYQTFTDGNIRDTLSFSMALVTPTGNYVLKIDNMSSFRAWSTDNIATQLKFNAMSDAFDTAYNGLLIAHKTKKDASELALLGALSGSGLMLFRGDSNLQNYQPIRQNQASVETYNCNN